MKYLESYMKLTSIGLSLFSFAGSTEAAIFLNFVDDAVVKGDNIEQARGTIM